MRNTTLELFEKISKGKINVLASDCIEWILGDMILVFVDDNREYTIKVCWKKRTRELTHLHIDDEDLDNLIKEIDDDRKTILVRNCILWRDFSITEKSKMKKQTFFRRYSI